MKFTTQDRDLLESARNGADYYERKDAERLRHFEKLGLVEITKAQTVGKKDGAKRLPYFGAILKPRGLRMLNDPPKTEYPRVRTQVNVAVFQCAEKWLLENINDMTIDGTTTVRPVEFYKSSKTWRVEDKEEEIEAVLTLNDLVAGLQLLAEQVGDTLHVGGIESPKMLTDGGNWDVEVTDAFWQLAFYGEVIYG